ncbi:hypothetical protein FNV43_RR20723 [Rhamnella rubrinervis]|uniref:Uncharacterized protein n=1 Tax=Rhamnella rubrinervis TaxID=2594499 RepID=A0A8K0GQR0_9ROSA|nr:hypothetical protein FNV43_RR20723 [Rhamnella rubrinervis]
MVRPTGIVVGLKNMDWAMIVVAFCFTSAVDLAFLSLQIHPRQFPLIIYLFSLTILFGLASLLLSKFIDSKFPNTAQTLEGASVFFVVTAFFIAITIPFPLCLKFVAWTVRFTRSTGWCLGNHDKPLKPSKYFSSKTVPPIRSRSKLRTAGPTYRTSYSAAQEKPAAERPTRAGVAHYSREVIGSYVFGFTVFNT